MPSGIYKRTNFHKESIRNGKKTGKNAYQWKGGLPKCICGKQLSRYDAKMCQECFHKYLKGNNHPKYILDRNKLVKKQERNDTAYKEWRKKIWLRDGYKCKIANPDCKGRIEAHHILGWKDYPELRYEVNNGITLCHFHHPRKRKDEMRLSPYFQELVVIKSKTICQ